jgi:predicted nucleic acid-binding protein
MLAVSNTSPISNLACIGRLDLLKSQFTALWIPAAVAQELNAHPDPAALAAINAAIRDQFIRITQAQDTPFKRMLSGQIHAGEAEAIAMAADLKADAILIDEQEGRALATQAGLAVTGTLGVLLRAKRSGHIPAIKPRFTPCAPRPVFFLWRSKQALYPQPENELKCSSTVPLHKK